mmetsp:Transcript_4918/g.10755  ORF Transcript_4918/g.10755 Transcript_4918/m.10755 type:complete len:99 (+) Transcript_4918:962-1258(+)
MILTKPPSQLFHQDVRNLDPKPMRRFQPGSTLPGGDDSQRPVSARLVRAGQMTGLRAVHYEKMAERFKVDIPEKAVAAIPGYAGFVARKVRPVLYSVS